MTPAINEFKVKHHAGEFFRSSCLEAHFHNQSVQPESSDDFPDTSLNLSNSSFNFLFFCLIICSNWVSLKKNTLSLMS